MGGSDPRRLIEGIPWSSSGDALVTSDGGRTSYATLRQRVDARARAFADLGAEPSSAVVVHAASPTVAVEASLAALSLGCVLVPCDARAPAAVAERMAARVDASLVFVERGGAEELAPSRASAPRRHDSRAALILFTSGSSAEPKGVVLGADGLAHCVGAILDYLPVDAASCVATTLPLGYSYGLAGQVLTALTAGASILLLQDVAFAAEQAKRMADLGATVWSSVPVSLRAVARATLDLELDLPLRVVASAGAPLDDRTRALVAEAFPRASFFNQYGLTEASPRVAALEATSPKLALGSVGRPIRGVEVAVLSADGRMLASGEEGEIAVRGPTTMLAYLDDEARTRDAFTEDGWLRSGDVGHLDADGYLYVAGRGDGVIKSAGERVSVREVEAALARLGGVVEVAVVAVPHEELGAVLVAFVEALSVDRAAVLAHARRELPPAKRPRRVEIVAALPRTDNGKVALAELRRLAIEGEA